MKELEHELCNELKEHITKMRHVSYGDVQFLASICSILNYIKPKSVLEEIMHDSNRASA